MTALAASETEPVVQDDPDEDAPECSECETELAYHHGDKLCPECGLVSEPPLPTVTDPWGEWQEHRRENDDISGWYGYRRIRFVGGFEEPWYNEDGFVDDVPNHLKRN